MLKSAGRKHKEYRKSVSEGDYQWNHSSRLNSCSIIVKDITNYFVGTTSLKIHIWESLHYMCQEPKIIKDGNLH